MTVAKPKATGIRKRRVIAVDAFLESLAKLDKSEWTVAAFRTLALEIATAPENGLTLPRKTIRVIRTKGRGPFPPLRLYYWMDDEALYLLDLQVHLD